MTSWLLFLLRGVAGITCSRASLATENALLRHQLAVLLRERPRQPFQPADRVLWIWLCRHWNRWCSALVLFKPETVLRWPREADRRHRRRRSGGSGGGPRIPQSHIRLIRRLSSDYPEWGEDRIALELETKLGVPHAASTIRRYLVRNGGGGPASTTWLCSQQGARCPIVPLSTAQESVPRICLALWATQNASISRPDEVLAEYGPWPRIWPGIRVVPGSSWHSLRRLSLRPPVGDPSSGYSPSSSPGSRFGGGSRSRQGSGPLQPCRW